jgi:hypothetical protein
MRALVLFPVAVLRLALAAVLVRRRRRAAARARLEERVAALRATNPYEVTGPIPRRKT